MTVKQNIAKYPEVWRRFNPRETLMRYLWYLGAVFVAVWSISNLDIPWFYFLDAHVQAKDLAVRMWPPDWDFASQLVKPLIETIHIATLGTLVTILIAFPVAFLAARNTTFNAMTWFVGRFILVASRSVNTVVWGLLFVAIFGPGPLLAGALDGDLTAGIAGNLWHHRVPLGYQYPRILRSRFRWRRWNRHPALLFNQPVISATVRQRIT
jgi:ABC-type phosphate/phosphonate transport system permease subunit